MLSADSGLTGYDTRPTLDDEGWRTLLGNLDRLAARAAERGITAVLHPHVGTMVENPDDVRRVLDGSRIALCLDTGHLLIGGTDPAELARQVPGRIAHTHMKDVDGRFARRVQGGELTYTEAVRDGMYRPLGSGDVDVAAIVSSLEGNGYGGWYVLEQDTILTGDPSGEGPVADVRASVEYLRGVFARSAADARTTGPGNPCASASWGPRGSASCRSSARRTRRAPGSSRSLRATGRARRRSRRATASSGSSTPTTRWSPTRRSRSSTTLWPTRCTRPGTSRRCGGPPRAHREAVGEQRREARAVRDAVVAAQVTLMEGFHYPYHPLHARLHELVASGDLGDLRAVEIHMVMPPPADGDPRWQLDLAGGGLMDVGCYGLHALRLLAGLLVGRPARGRAGRGARPGVDAWLEAELELPGGVPATMRCGMNGPAYDFSYRLVGIARRGVRTGVPPPAPRRHDRGDDSGRVARRGAGPPVVVHLPARRAGRAPARRRTGDHRRRRRGRDDGADRRDLPGGRT